MELTSHERLMRIFKNQPIDRPAFKLWGAYSPSDPLLHESYRPVTELAAKTTDIFANVSDYGLDPIGGLHVDRYVEAWKQ